MSSSAVEGSGRFASWTALKRGVTAYERRVAAREKKRGRGVRASVAARSSAAVYSRATATARMAAQTAFLPMARRLVTFLFHAAPSAPQALQKNEYSARTRVQ